MSGKGSVLNCGVFHPLDLTRREWEIGLVDFTLCNAIPKIEDGVNHNIAIETISV